MRPIKSLDSVGFDELLGILNGMGNRLLLIRISGKDAFLYGNGRVMREYINIPRDLRDVEVVELDKFEFLDLLQGKAEPKRTPMTVEFSYSLDAPKDIYIHLEDALLKAVLKAYKTLGIAIERADLKASIRYGATGRDILLIRGNVKGLSSSEVEKTELARVLSDVVSRETGFDARVLLRGFDLVKTRGKPLLRVSAPRAHVRGGRVLEVPLARNVAPSLNRDKVQAEVERILEEAGIEELAGKLKRDTERRVQTGAIEAFLRERLSGIRDVQVNWIKVSPEGDGGVKVAIGASRRSKSRSDVEIASMVGKEIEAAQREGRARGLAFKVSSAFLVLEEDVY